MVREERSMNQTLARRPMAEFATMRDTVDRLFNETLWGSPFRTLWGSTGNGGARWPLPLDVYATQNDVAIIAAVPGLGPDDIQVTLDQGVVTFSGQLPNVAASEEGKGATWYLHELPRGSFQRSVALPFEVNADAAEATFQHGILYLRLPKAEQARPKQIKVQVVEHGAQAQPAEAIASPAS
jgi:HSP20 family protein